MSAGQNEIYTATLAVPKSTAAGAYYGLVVFNNTANINDTPIGVNVIVNVGTVTKSLSIVSLDTTKLQVTDQWSAKGQLELNLKNTGTGYFVPEKTLIEIVDNQNIVLDSIEGNPDNNGILPNNTFKFIIPVSKLLTPNKKYNARVKIFIAANEAPIVGETNIVTPPIKDAKGKVQATTAPEAKPKKNLFLIIGGGVVLLLVALLIAFLIHDRKKKRTARAVTTPNVPEPNLQVAAELGLNPATEPSSTEQPTTPPVVELPQAPETHEVTEASQEPPTQHS